MNSIENNPATTQFFKTTDTISYTAQFIPSSKDFLCFVQRIKDPQQRERLINERFQLTFGKMDTVITDPKQPIIPLKVRLLCLSEKELNAIDNNNYRAPTGFFEKWKWMAEVENRLDKEVQETYEVCIDLLKNSTASTIIQSKNQELALWHLHRQIKDYQIFRDNEKTRAQSNWIKEIFFACVWKILKCFYSAIVDIKILALEHIVKIGHFRMDNHDYNVCVINEVNDIRSYTRVGVCPNSVTPYFSSSFPIQFEIEMGRQKAKTQPLKLFYENISSEFFSIHGIVPVLNQRHLIFRNWKFNGRTEDDVGSDRRFDQILIQIMMEIALQNEKICSLRSGSEIDDLPLFTAAGFECSDTEEQILRLNQFRSKRDNKLFPPFFNGWQSDHVMFDMENFGKENVRFSKETVESWPAIIEKNPILRPNSARIPEYLAKKPNIVQH